MTALLSLTFSSEAQDNILHSYIYTDETKDWKAFCFHFRINSSAVDSSFMSNGKTLSLFRENVLNMRTFPDTVYIRSTASPDGSYDFNVNLAINRGRSLSELLTSSVPALDSAVFVYECVSEDWAMLERVIQSCEDCPQRETALSILHNKSLSDTEKKSLLKSCEPFFDWLQREYAYLTRSASAAYIIRHRNRETPLTQPSLPKDTLRYIPPPINSKVSAGLEEKKIILAARTNLLVPLLNVGIEIPIGEKITVGIDYYYPWWLAASNQYCSEMLGLFADCRWWFSKGKRIVHGLTGNRLCGHAVGIYCGVGYYDYQWRSSGYQGEYMDVGIDYTFAIPVIHDKLRLEFNIGVGCIYNQYRHYNPDKEYKILIKDMMFGEQIFHFFGPTRASVSLVIPIYKKVKYRNSIESEREH